MVLSYVKRFLRLYAGLFLCAVSILLAIQGGVGVTPWDVFHMGIQNITGISYGTVNILVGLCILTTSIVLGEPIGFGTLCNTLSVGYMVDFLKWLNWVPAAPNAIAGCGMIMIRQKGRSLSAAIRYMILSQLGSGLVLIGLSLLMM